ncbi:hypothetical protein SVIO_064130 [Streptomyces violaceusniger]|uniref:Uncharacterized protein n=1 Tax=Streptomyces violaceusniger TaxID=68280 RepID=A0A4D4L9T5_STRVO|nr:hypothetical protein SVIO_064130 [Streptomyces violaceusniger]
MRPVRLGERRFLDAEQRGQPLLQTGQTARPRQHLAEVEDHGGRGVHIGCRTDCHNGCRIGCCLGCCLGCRIGCRLGCAIQAGTFHQGNVTGEAHERGNGDGKAG